MFIDSINKYSEKDPVRFHMPGHKGIVNFNLTAGNDVTELFFTDNLYHPDGETGFVHDLERRVSECFFKNGDTDCVISCGGATLLIQASILHILREYNKKNRGSGQRYMLCDRNSHMSLINALALCSIEPVWFFDVGEINAVLASLRDTAIIGVFITSPDYYSQIHDIKKAAESAHAHSLPLIADNSHGSHLAFHENGSLHPMKCGADYSVDSLHKTLPVLTGGAVMHFRKSKDKENIRAAMRVFASTSPSFLILQSVESAISFLHENGSESHANLLSEINKFKKAVKDYGIINDSERSDPFRIVLNLGLYNKRGEDLYFFLAEKDIICEFYDKKNVIIIPSVNNREEDFIRLLTALKYYFANIKKNNHSHKNSNHPLRLPERALSLRECVLSPCVKIKAASAANRIAAELVAPYPPGVPVIICGERIDNESANELAKIKEYIYVIE